MLWKNRFDLKTCLLIHEVEKKHIGLEITENIDQGTLFPFKLNVVWFNTVVLFDKLLASGYKKTIQTSLQDGAWL